MNIEKLNRELAESYNDLVAAIRNGDVKWNCSQEIETAIGDLHSPETIQRITKRASKIMKKVIDNK